MLKSESRIFTIENFILNFYSQGKAVRGTELRSGPRKFLRLFCMDIVSCASFLKPYSVRTHIPGTQMACEQKFGVSLEGSERVSSWDFLKPEKRARTAFASLHSCPRALLLSVYKTITYPSKCNLRFRFRQ